MLDLVMTEQSLNRIERISKIKTDFVFFVVDTRYNFMTMR